jgi:hypothetical protein
MEVLLPCKKKTSSPAYSPYIANVASHVASLHRVHTDPRACGPALSTHPLPCPRILRPTARCSFFRLKHFGRGRRPSFRCGRRNPRLVGSPRAPGLASRRRPLRSTALCCSPACRTGTLLRGGPSSSQGYSIEYPLFLPKHLYVCSLCRFPHACMKYYILFKHSTKDKS